jgi:hypothetical protein
MSKKTLVVLFLALVLSALSSGCSTILNGAVQDLKVNTKPAGVQVRIGNQTCVTPCTLMNVWRRSEFIVISETNKDTRLPLASTITFGSFYFGNIFSWNIIGMIIDSSVGSKYELEPVDLVLTNMVKPTAAAGTMAPTSATICPAGTTFNATTNQCIGVPMPAANTGTDARAGMMPGTVR